MPLTLTSPHLHFTLNPQAATWSLHGTQLNAPFIEDAWMQVNYQTPISALLRSGRRKHISLQTWPKAQINHSVTFSPHGELQQITLESGPDANRLFYKIEFALPQEHPLFLWRLTIENRGQSPVQMDRITLMQAGFFPKRKLLPEPGPLSAKYRRKPIGYGAIRPHPDPGKLAFFTNGWQSWSFTGTLGTDEWPVGTSLGFMAAPMWFNQGTPRLRKRGRFASDMFGVLGDRLHRSGILAGFLSQKQHFGSLEVTTDPIYPALALWANGDQARLEPGAQISTDWAALQFVNLDDPEPLAPYLDAVARENRVQPSIPSHQPSVGWCSWYQFYQDISAEKMRANLQSAASLKNELHLNLFQIDDGFQAQIGDWFNFSSGFPQGVAPLSSAIRETGLNPGLWLAPFIVHSKSKLRRTQRKWLLRNRFGVPVNAGFVWNNFNKALDLTHPEALAYTQEVVRTAVHEWGYSFLKLDFLFAAALPGRNRDRSQTRAQALRRGLEALREAAGPEVHLLGCGVPLGSGIGIFDSMRIGADVDGTWLPTWKGLRGLFKEEYAMPSARNALQNTLTRAPLHRRWWLNDPDCLLVRPESNLTLAEVQTLASAIALTGGSLLLSDDLPALPDNRLRLASQLLPLIGKRGRLLDWFEAATPHLLRLDLENATGAWYLVALFNWADQVMDISVPLEKLGLSAVDTFAREFWRGSLSRVTDGLLTLKNIPAHGVGVVALRPATPGKAAYLGSDLHISQGLEVIQWLESPENLRLRLERPGKAQGVIDLYLPRPPSRVVIQHKNIDFEPLGEGIYRIPVDFERVAEIEII